MPVSPPTITERLVKQQPLTASEMDTNLTDLKTYTTGVETSYSGGTGTIDGSCISDKTMPPGSVDPTGSASGNTLVSAGPSAAPVWGDGVTAGTGIAVTGSTVSQGATANGFGTRTVATTAPTGSTAGTNGDIYYVVEA